MKILITGGAGYIGSHTIVELLNAGIEVVVVDNLCNSSPKVFDRLKEITGKSVKFYNADILDKQKLDEIFKKESINKVLHLASLKVVGDSIKNPWQYYNNNITGTLNLIDVMEKNGVKNIVFSSSASIYGNSEVIPVTEDCQKATCTNPYAWTKFMSEQILTDIQKADSDWNVILLRYFNPVGAHESGLIGEDPKNVPTNILPYITQVATKKLKEFSIYGNDYPTHDGTGIRDYIHVVDIAKANLKALKKLDEKIGLGVYNVGSGKGISVLDILKSFERVNNIKIPFVIKPRREGDIAISYCSNAKAEKELGFKARLDLDQICRDAWNWQSKNPRGFE